MKIPRKYLILIVYVITIEVVTCGEITVPDTPLKIGFNKGSIEKFRNVLTDTGRFTIYFKNTGRSDLFMTFIGGPPLIFEKIELRDARGNLKSFDFPSRGSAKIQGNEYYLFISAEKGNRNPCYVTFPKLLSDYYFSGMFDLAKFVASTDVKNISLTFTMDISIYDISLKEFTRYLERRFKIIFDKASDGSFEYNGSVEVIK